MKQKKETHAQSHCERSVAIAKLSNCTSDAITTQTSFARNDKRRAFTLSEGATHVGTCDNVRKSAFTLAEVLITLAIIGVVATMTIPTLISDYKEKATIIKLKGTYSMLANAWALACTNKGDYSGTTSAELYEYLTPFLKLSKSCNREAGCFPNAMIRYLHGGEWINIDSYRNYSKAILSNGALIQFYSRKVDNTVIEFRIDTNGFAEPNTLGKDIFYFEIINNVILPFGQKGTDFRPFETHCNLASTVNYNGDACAAWVIENNNMDYLHCNDLSWNGKRSCKD